MLSSEPFWYFVNERHAIWHRKQYMERNVIPPDSIEMYIEKGVLTIDPILETYRFCNVFRELDRVTLWIHENIRKPYAEDKNLWLMLAIARTLNWPETLKFIIKHHKAGSLLGWCWPEDGTDFDPFTLGRALSAYQTMGNKVFTGAYVIRAESEPSFYWYGWPKVKYIAEIVCGFLWRDREEWYRLFESKPSLEQVWVKFQENDAEGRKRYIGWGPFMAYQAIVDMRHTKLLCKAPDINTWAALGPGSKRGLNRLRNYPVECPLSQEEGLELMLELYAEQDKKRAPWVPRIDLSDIQNSLCETDKYLRVLNREGRPRARYIRGRGY